MCICEYKKAVLFDLDGVLIDSEGIYTDFWNEVDHRFPTGVDNFALVIKGNTLSRILNTYFPDADTQSKIREILREQERRMVYRPFARVRELLRELREAGFGVAIVTSSNRAKMRHLFEALPWLEESIDTLVTDEDVTASKPDPQGYLLAAKRLGVNPGNCVVVEDSLAGLEAGRRAGAKVAGIATTNGRKKVAPLADITVGEAGLLTADTISTLLI